MAKRQYPKMTPEQEQTLRKVAEFDQVADGSYAALAPTRNELNAAVRAARDADCEVSVFIGGLNAETLAFCAQAICDLAVDEGVSVRFQHRDKVMRLKVDLDVPAGAELTSAP